MAIHAGFSAGLVQGLSVAVGGALGSWLRWQVNRWCAPWATVWPYSTLAVNVLGSCLMGLLAALALRGVVSEPMRLALGTGFLGGLTTFSALALELTQLPTAHAWLHALLNLGLGLAAAYVGLWLGGAKP